jgi:glycosyltransferase involved in cell wall biosynthesis
MKLLSILIPTLPERKHFLTEILSSISEQINGANAWDKVEVITNNAGREITTGTKRNGLLEESKGKYVWFVDDDDSIYPYAIEEILKAAEKDPDVIGINGIMTTDGVKQIDWEIRLGHDYKAIQKNGKEYYLRFPNHITPMKREHAIRVKFPNKTVFEDYEWAKSLNDAGYLKTQEIIDKPIYHYKCRTKK